MELNQLICNVIRRSNRRRTGVVVVELPGHDGPLLLCAALCFYYAAWTEICPGKFLFACPHQLHWLSCCLGQSRSLNRAFAGMLSAIRRAGVRNQYANLLWRHVEGRRKLIAYGERTLRAGPHRELV